MNSFKLEKPLLFMVFNRPEKTKIVWEEIKKVKPKKLYISCDGPRQTHPDDEAKVNKVKEIVSEINWQCDVKRLFHKDNLGVSMAGNEAFGWVFSQEEDMIQLEDDCVPTKSFFWFCQEMLEKYKNNEKICYVTTNNHSGVKSGRNATYFFSRYGGSWGWATWKRVWDQWDYLMSEWPKVKNSRVFKDNCNSEKEYEYWKFVFERIYKSLNKGTSGSYDFQTLFLILSKDMYNIYPNYNLVENIGWDEDASNTPDKESKFANIPSQEITEIIHPSKIELTPEIEDYIFHYHFYDYMPITLKQRAEPYIGFIYPFLRPFKRALKKIKSKL